MIVAHIPYYTGTKSLLRPNILRVLLPLGEAAQEYREPFVGGGAIALSMMSRQPNLVHWLNDRDPAVACIWWTIQDHCQVMIARVEAFRPSIDEFDRLKSLVDDVIRVPRDEAEIVEVGFASFALGYMRFNGFGGGMRGGRAQMLDRIGERWKPESIVRTIDLIHRRLQRLNPRISGYDYSRLLAEADHHVVLYVDPPYLGASSTYRYGFTREDHERLADLLGNSRHSWCLSYGDQPEIRRLYRWARIEEIGYRNLLICGQKRGPTEKSSEPEGASESSGSVASPAADGLETRNTKAPWPSGRAHGSVPGGRLETQGGVFLLGDCRERLAKIEPGSVQLLVTSPPYNAGKRFGSLLSLSGYERFARDWCTAAVRTLDRNAGFWINLGYMRISAREILPLTYLYYPIIRDLGMHFVQETIWHFEGGLAYKRRFSHRTERWQWWVSDPKSYLFDLDAVRDPLLNRSADPRNNPLGKNPTDYWYHNKSGRSSHPCPFPIAMIERIILAHSRPGDVVLDPFGGAGTTALAARLCGRRFIYIEQNQDYFNHAVEAVTSSRLPIQIGHVL